MKPIANVMHFMPSKLSVKRTEVESERDTDTDWCRHLAGPSDVLMTVRISFASNPRFARGS